MKFFAQEVFDIVYEGLSKQGFRKSVDDEGEPLTVSPNGDRDPIGHILGDYYIPGFQGMTVWGLCSIVEIWDMLAVDQEKFLEDLLLCHDAAQSPEDMKSRLDNFARNMDNYGILP